MTMLRRRSRRPSVEMSTPSIEMEPDESLPEKRGQRANDEGTRKRDTEEDALDEPEQG